MNNDISAALLHNAIDGRESKTRAIFLGGEKRFKDAGLGFGIHAGARVLNGEQNILSCRQFKVSAGTGVVLHPDVENAAVGHGITSVGGEIENYLLNLTLVCIDDANFLLA